VLPVQFNISDDTRISNGYFIVEMLGHDLKAFNPKVARAISVARQYLITRIVSF